MYWNKGIQNVLKWMYQKMLKCICWNKGVNIGWNEYVKKCWIEYIETNVFILREINISRNVEMNISAILMSIRSNWLHPIRRVCVFLTLETLRSLQKVGNSKTRNGPSFTYHVLLWVYCFIIWSRSSRE